MTRVERDPDRARAAAVRELAVGIDDVRELTAGLPRSYEVLVRGRIKFRVGRIVYLAFSRDETLMGFAFPKEEREAALETYPGKFLRPRPSASRVPNTREIGIVFKTALTDRHHTVSFWFRHVDARADAGPPLR